MAKKIASQEAQTPLILRCHRLMDAFAKSNDERDFYLNRKEGFLVYVDLDRGEEELEALEHDLHENMADYCIIPKLTFYETKKIMEGFITEKVYDIDTKEKLLDIIQSKEARENFLEFISDHHAEFEKWQQYYQERSRIRIIEWLRINHFHFVFEEDLELDSNEISLLKHTTFDSKANKEVSTLRKSLITKAKTYYSTEALNPRPKRGRPPKQAAKVEVEANTSIDVFLTPSSSVRPFLYTPETSLTGMGFSAKFDDEISLLVPKRPFATEEFDNNTASLDKKISMLRQLSSKWLDDDEDDEDEDEDFRDSRKIKRPAPKEAAKKKESVPSKASSLNGKSKKLPNKVVTSKNIKPPPKVSKTPPKSAPIKASAKNVVASKTKPAPKFKAPVKPPAKPKPKPKPKPKAKAASTSKVAAKPPAKIGRRPVLRSIVKSKKK